MVAERGTRQFPSDFDWIQAVVVSSGDAGGAEGKGREGKGREGKGREGENARVRIYISKHARVGFRSACVRAHQLQCGCTPPSRHRGSSVFDGGSACVTARR